MHISCNSPVKVHRVVQSVPDKLRLQAGCSVLWCDVVVLRGGVVVVVLAGLDASIGEKKWSSGGMGGGERETACLLEGTVPTCAQLRC